MWILQINNNFLKLLFQLLIINFINKKINNQIIIELNIKKQI